MVMRDNRVTTNEAIKELSLSNDSYHRIKRANPKKMVMVKRGLTLERVLSNSIILGMVAKTDILHTYNLFREDELIRKGELATQLLKHSVFDDYIKPDVKKKKQN